MKKGFLIILGMWVLSHNAFSQIWTEPKPLFPDDPGGEFPHFATDTSGRIWSLFTKRGVQLTYFNPESDSWILRDTTLQLPPDNDRIGGFFRDKKGNLWVTNGNYAAYYDGNSWSPPMKIPKVSGWSGLHNSVGGGDSAGNIWVAWTTADEEEIYCSWYDWKVWHSPIWLTGPPPTYDNMVSSLITDKFGRIWVAWWKCCGSEGVYTTYYDGEKWSDFFLVDSIGDYPKLACDSKGRVWATWIQRFRDTTRIYVGYYEKGKWSISAVLSKGEVSGYPHYIIPLPVITVDRLDRVWVVWNSPRSDTLGDIWFSFYNGKEWSEPAPIDTARGIDKWAALGVDGEGRVWCGWDNRQNRFSNSNIYVSHTCDNEPPEIAPFPDTSFFEDDSLMLDLDDYVEDPDDPDSLLTWDYTVLKTPEKRGPIYVDIDDKTHITTIKTDPNWNGSFNVIFTAMDPLGLSDSGAMSVEVIPVNDPPVITKWGPPSPDTVETSDTLYISAEDIDNDPLTYIWSINGTVDNSARDTFYIYTPAKPTVDKVEAIVSDGELADSVEWVIVAQSQGIEQRYQGLPKVFSLSQNSPNPFGSTTIILYSVAEPSYVSLNIYNASGQLVRILVDEDKKPGYYTVIWNGEDGAGKKVPVGVYFYRMETENFSKTHKTLLLR